VGVGDLKTAAAGSEEGDVGAAAGEDIDDAVADQDGAVPPPRSSTVAPIEMVVPLMTAPDSMISVPPALMTVVLAVAPESTSSAPPLLTVVLVSSPPLAISSVPPLLMVQWALLALVTVHAPPTTLKIVNP
jgi:hypothetical protein